MMMRALLVGVAVGAADAALWKPPLLASRSSISAPAPPAGFTWADESFDVKISPTKAAAKLTKAAAKLPSVGLVRRVRSHGPEAATVFVDIARGIAVALGDAKRVYQLHLYNMCLVLVAAAFDAGRAAVAMCKEYADSGRLQQLAATAVAVWSIGALRVRQNAPEAAGVFVDLWLGVLAAARE